MKIAIPQKKITPTENESQSIKASGLANLAKKLQSGEEIHSENIKELAKYNIGQTRDRLQSFSDQTIGDSVQAKWDKLGDLHGENKILGNKKIDTNFFLRQKGFSSSNIKHNGGRL